MDMKVNSASMPVTLALVVMACAIPLSALAASSSYQFTVPKGAHAQFHQTRPPPAHVPAGWSLRAIISSDDGVECTLGDEYGGNPDYAPPMNSNKDVVWTVRFFSVKSDQVPKGQPNNFVAADWETLTGTTTNQGQGTQFVEIKSIPRSTPPNPTTDTHTLTIKITGAVGSFAQPGQTEQAPPLFPSTIPAPCPS